MYIRERVPIAVLHSEVTDVPINAVGTDPHVSLPSRRWFIALMSGRKTECGILVRFYDDVLNQGRGEE